MKYFVLLTALIALLGCGSSSNPISPNPSADMNEPTEKNEVPVVENPLVEPPEGMADPPLVGVIIVPPEQPVVEDDPEIEALIEAIIRELPEPPELPEVVDDPLVGVIIVPPERPDIVDDPEIKALIEAIIRELPEPPENPLPDQE